MTYLLTTQWIMDHGIMVPNFMFVIFVLPKSTTKVAEND